MAEVAGAGVTGAAGVAGVLRRGNYCAGGCWGSQCARRQGRRERRRQVHAAYSKGQCSCVQLAARGVLGRAGPCTLTHTPHTTPLVSCCAAARRGQVALRPGAMPLLRLSCTGQGCSVLAVCRTADVQREGFCCVGGRGTEPRRLRAGLACVSGRLASACMCGRAAPLGVHFGILCNIPSGVATYRVLTVPEHAYQGALP